MHESRSVKRERLNRWVRDRLIDAYRSTGLTIPAFSRATKISTRQVQKILRGETESTSVENLVHWALACGVHPSDFFRQLRPELLEEGRETEEQKLMDQFSRAILVERQRKALEAILASLVDGA